MKNSFSTLLVVLLFQRYGVECEPENLASEIRQLHLSENTETPMIPLPPAFFFPITYRQENEPKFDEALHLSLEKPSKVALLDDFVLREQVVPSVDLETGSLLAFTAPFRMFSEEGVRVLHDIVMREKEHARRNHRNVELRGLYYRSPFIRDLMTSPALLKFLAEQAGEPLWPHFLLMDAPSVNFGDSEQETVIKGVMDPWHFDSVAYVGVALISDITDMQGGKLQVVKHRRKRALQLIKETGNNLPEEDVLTVDYETAGFCIFVQGSEMVHRVTRVVRAKEPRLSLVMAFQPANPFHPDKTILDTWMRFDEDIGSAPYEFFRLKAQKAASALQTLVNFEQPTRDRQKLADKLRSITAELERVIALLDGSISDFIGFVNESKFGLGDNCSSSNVDITDSI